MRDMGIIQVEKKIGPRDIQNKKEERQRDGQLDESDTLLSDWI